MYHGQIEEVADIRRSNQWLEHADLKDSTEALITAAQEQVLSTTSIEAGVYRSPRCKIYRKCKTLAGTAHRDRRNHEARVAYRNSESGTDWKSTSPAGRNHSK